MIRIICVESASRCWYGSHNPLFEALEPDVFGSSGVSAYGKPYVKQPSPQDPGQRSLIKSTLQQNTGSITLTGRNRDYKGLVSVLLTCRHKIRSGQASASKSLGLLVELRASDWNCGPEG